MCSSLHPANEAAGPSLDSVVLAQQLTAFFKSHRWTKTWITWPGSLLFPSGIVPIPLSTFPRFIFLRHGPFQNRSCFLNAGSFPSLWSEHEDDKGTLCIAPGSKGAAASDVPDHSLLLCSSSSSPSEEEV